MQLTLTLDEALAHWAAQQADAPGAVLTILRAHLGRTVTPLDRLSDLLREQLRTLPDNLEFEIPQVIGFQHWEVLDRSTRLTFGKHVRANAEAFGLAFVRKTAANHAVYRKHQP